jgi:hypothetical protein
MEVENLDRVRPWLVPLRGFFFTPLIFFIFLIFDF